MPKGYVTTHHPCLGSKFSLCRKKPLEDEKNKISDDKLLKVVNPFSSIHIHMMLIHT